MRVLGLGLLEEFANKHANCREAISSWIDDMENSNWNSPQDVKNRYPSADFLSNNRVIFNIKGNHYRLVIKVRYQNALVLVEWLGTHAEYNKIKF